MILLKATRLTCYPIHFVMLNLWNIVAARWFLLSTVVPYPAYSLEHSHLALFWQKSAISDWRVERDSGSWWMYRVLFKRIKKLSQQRFSAEIKWNPKVCCQFLINSFSGEMLEVKDAPSVKHSVLAFFRSPCCLMTKECLSRNIRKKLCTLTKTKEALESWWTVKSAISTKATVD